MVKEGEPRIPPTDKKDPSLLGPQSRRRFLVRGLVATAVVLKAGTIGIEIATHWDDILKFAEDRLPDSFKRAKTAKQEFDEIINSLSTESELLSGVYRKGEQLDLSGYPTNLGVDVFGLGDSNFYTDGEKNDTPGPDKLATPDNQPNSFLEQAGNALQQALPDLGIESWATHTYAVPGAPSGIGFDGETRKYGLLSNEQLNRENFIDRLRNGNQVKIVNIGLHGDDWRELAKDAFELAAFFRTISNIDKITDDQLTQLKKLKAKSDAIAASYGQHITEALATIGKINEERIHSGLPSIKVVVNYPVSAHGVDHIPFRTIAQDETTHPELSKVLKQVPGKKDRYYLDLNEIPSGKDIAYIITDSIYNQLSSVLPKAAKDNPQLDIYSVVWMGLEKQKDLFYIDGHLNEQGISRVAQLFLQLFKKKAQDGSYASLAKVASL